MPDSAVPQNSAGSCLHIGFLPISELVFNKILAYDVCVSLITDELGHVAYKAFKPLAERTKINAPLERWIFKNTCQKAAKLRKKAKFDYITLNVSTRYLKSDNYVFDLLDMLKGLGIAPESICIEVEESDLQADADSVINKLHELKREGFMIGIDDYSAVYLPLARLDSIPADIIKIDPSLIAKIVIDKKAETETAAIIKRAKVLKAQVVAKGVDTQQLRFAMMAMGCERVQDSVKDSRKKAQSGDPEFPQKQVENA